MEILNNFLCFLIGGIVIASLSFIICSILKSPIFDVSDKRFPKVNDLIDNHLNKYVFEEFPQHYEIVEQWKRNCKEHIKRLN